MPCGFFRKGDPENTGHGPHGPGAGNADRIKTRPTKSETGEAGIMEPARITNRNVSEILYEVAGLLEMKEPGFKPRAYRMAARAVETLPEDITEVYLRGELEGIPGVGRNIAAKIREIVETGNLAYLAKLKNEFPEGVPELTELEGIGPKKAVLLNRELGIRNIDDLEAAAKEGKLRDIPGFGEKSGENILRSIRLKRSARGRFLLGEILPVAEGIREKIAACPATGRIEIAGSLRRMKETIGDLDIVAASPRPEEVMALFCSLPQVERVLVRGPTRSTVIVTGGIQVDLRVVAADQFGSALQYFTGSKEHNIALRRRAIERNRKLNEYGLLDLATGTTIAGRDEHELYRKLDLPYIEPELREMRGELGAAENGTLPDLVSYDAVRGDLHVHTEWSDGSDSIQAVAEAAHALGYEYIAICDHAGGMPFARGLTEERLRDQEKEIERVNRGLDGLTVLAGTECTINAKGDLDLPGRVLEDLDIVVAGIHSGFRMPEPEMTARVLAALENEHLDILAHPTGRILRKREAVSLSLPRVFAAAAGRGLLLEINAYPSRLDLSDTNCRSAKDRGVRFALGTDAHARENLWHMKLGVATARRGWLSAPDIVNTLSLKDLRKTLGP